MTPFLIAAVLLSGPTVREFTVDGVKRTALVYEPTRHTKKLSPTVVVFHGYGGSSEFVAKQFHVQDLWPDALVLYPQGLPFSFGPRGSVERPGWQVMPGQKEDRDVKFLDAMVKWATDSAGADPSHLFIAGHSNGSGFAWVVLKERGAKFAAFAGLNGGTLLPLESAPVRPAFLATGTNDKVVPPESVRQFAKRLAKHNGCGEPRVTDRTTLYPGKAQVQLFEYNGGHMPPATTFDKVVAFFKSI